MISTGNKLTDFLYRKASNMRIPLSGTFELSPVCNFSCRMCYVRKSQREVELHSRKMLTLDDWLIIAREARSAGMLYLLLTGGEPLLWPDFWALYDELVEMGFLISINTNGSLIDKEAIAHFKKKPPHKINITLYGANDDTYERLCGVKGVFSKVDQAIRGLQEAGILVKLNCSLTPENAEDLEWIIAYGKERKTILAVSTYMFPPIRRDATKIGINERFQPEDAAKYQLQYFRRQHGEERYRQYLQHILEGYTEPLGLEEGCIDPLDGKIRCRAGKASFWVTWDGWLTPCGMMPEPKADIKAQGFHEAWKMLTQLTAELRLSGICDKCSDKEICHPCAAISYAETGTSTGIPAYMCKTIQQMQKIAKDTLYSEQK